MRHIVLFLSMLLMPLVAVAQDSLNVSLKAITISSDSTEITLQVGELTDSLRVPIWAFEFKLTTTEGIAYLGVSSISTLASKDGWTTAANVQNKWAGGFASRTNSIEVGGTLLAIYLDASQKKGSGEVCLTGIRLNSGDPRAVPKDVCSTIK
ncbi:hypothetical protein HQ496_09880 [bacterium]|nr:hypothetical protein [bacterium]